MDIFRYRMKSNWKKRKPFCGIFKNVPLLFPHYFLLSSDCLSLATFLVKIMLFLLVKTIRYLLQVSSSIFAVLGFKNLTPLVAKSSATHRPNQNRFLKFH